MLTILLAIYFMLSLFIYELYLVCGPVEEEGIRSPLSNVLIGRWQH
jgi:hypothetical protein